MAQLYLLINLDKREKMWSFAGGSWCGGRLTEQLVNRGIKPYFALSLLELDPRVVEEVQPGTLWGSWAGCRCVLIGDHCREPLWFLTDEEEDEIERMGEDIFGWAMGTFREAQNDPRLWSPANNEVAKLCNVNTHHVIVNIDQNEYLDPVEFGEDTCVVGFSSLRDGIMMALFSCLFYSTNVTAVGDIPALTWGRWAGDHLKIIEKANLPPGFKDVSKEVNEELQEKLREVKDVVLYGTE